MKKIFDTIEVSRILDVPTDYFNNFMGGKPEMRDLIILPVIARKFSIDDILSIDKVLPYWIEDISSDKVLPYKREDILSINKELPYQRLASENLEQRIILSALAIVARNPDRNEVVDEVGPLLINYPELEQILKSYQDVSLIES